MITFLSSDKAQYLLNTYKDETDPLRIRSLLKDECSQEEAIALSQQILLRQKAIAKFPHPEKMLFDKEGYEQATHACVAAYHAQLFEKDDILLDICTGIGSDVIAFSQQVQEVFTVDSDVTRGALATYNVSTLGNGERCHVIHADFKTFEIMKKVTAVFADPSRRVGGRRRVAPDDCRPTVTDILSTVDDFGLADGKCVIKLAPACDYEALLTRGRIEVISVDGAVKEVLFFRDAGRAGEVRAVVLKNEQFLPRTIYTIENTASVPKSVSKPRTYIIEPDGAIIRAGLVHELANEIGATFLQAQTAYLTCDSYGDARGYTAYRVIDSFDFNVKKLKKYFKDNDIHALSVKKRGARETAEQLQKKIGIKKGSNTDYLFVYRVGEKYKACLCCRT